MIKHTLKLLAFFALLFAFTSIQVNAGQSTSLSDVPTRADDIRPLLIGQTVPPITLNTAKGKPVKLADLLAQKPTLLVFYRGGWCPYCNLHLSELRKIEQPLLDMGFQILAISPDQPNLLNDTTTKNKLGYTLLSDSTATAAKAFGLAFSVDDTTQQKLKGHGIDLAKSAGQNHGLLPVPAAYIIDKNQLVHFNFVAPNYKVRVDNELILAGAKALLKAKKGE